MMVRGGGGGGWSGCNLGVNVVRVYEPVFRNLAIHILGLWKNGPINNVILDCQKCWPFIYCPFILYPFIAGIKSIHWIPRKPAVSKNLWSKKYTHIQGCQKSEDFHTRIQKKIGSVIYFLLTKGGLIMYLSALKKGPFGTHIRTMPYIESYHHHHHLAHTPLSTSF